MRKGLMSEQKGKMWRGWWEKSWIELYKEVVIVVDWIDELVWLCWIEMVVDWFLVMNWVWIDC